MSPFDCFQTGLDDQGRRLDRIVRKLYPGLPLSMLYRMFRTGSIRLSGRKAKGAELIEPGDEIMVRRPQGPDSLFSPPPNRERPSNPVDINKKKQFFESLMLARTPDLIILNKPKGMLTHGPGGLDEIASVYFLDRMQASLSFKPAPLHRLDRNTSGALAVSASIIGARAFSAAIRAGSIGKEYLALLDGRLEHEVFLHSSLSRDSQKRTSSIASGGKGPIAETRLFPLVASANHTLVAIRISTGLTHQIRVQSASLGFPLSGDRKYGGKARVGGYLLHCSKLEFPDDLGAESPKTVAAPLPQDFRDALESIFAPQSLDSAAFRRYP
jgi:23S rRNA pseudouridine955/2504/2580 synthase